MRRLFAFVAMLALTGCSRVVVDEQPPRTTLTSTAAPARETRPVTYVRTVPSYLGGLLGPGRVEPSSFCDEPVRIEVRVETRDVLASMLTLFTYTPETAYVTCEVPSRAARIGQ